MKCGIAKCYAVILQLFFYFKFSIIAVTAFSTFSLDVARFIRTCVPNFRLRTSLRSRKQDDIFSA